MPIVIYGIDGANNKIETMTKEQIVDAIVQAQHGQIPDLDSAFITQIKEINHGNALKFWIGTQAEYNAIQTKEINVLYIISDDNSKEEIIEAIENLAESLNGVQDAIDAKQDALTFDTAPTQNSMNPVTSGGIYTAINDITEKKTNLWTRSTSTITEFYQENDEITLSDSISNYDYIEFHIGVLVSQTPITYIPAGIIVFQAINNSKYCVMWIYTDYPEEYRSVFYINRMDLLINNNKITAIRALHDGRSSSTTTAQNSKTTIAQGTSMITKIYGVKN